MLHYLIIIFTTIIIRSLTGMIEFILSKIKANRAGHGYTRLQTGLVMVIHAYSPNTEKVETEELL